MSLPAMKSLFFKSRGSCLLLLVWQTTFLVKSLFGPLCVIILPLMYLCQCDLNMSRSKRDCLYASSSISFMYQTMLIDASWKNGLYKGKNIYFLLYLFLCYFCKYFFNVSFIDTFTTY